MNRSRQYLVRVHSLERGGVRLRQCPADKLAPADPSTGNFLTEQPGAQSGKSVRGGPTWFLWAIQCNR
jgi:hypothetical protein